MPNMQETRLWEKEIFISKWIVQTLIDNQNLKIL